MVDVRRADRERERTAEELATIGRHPGCAVVARAEQPPPCARIVTLRGARRQDQQQREWKDIVSLSPPARRAKGGQPKTARVSHCHGIAPGCPVIRPSTTAIWYARNNPKPRLSRPDANRMWRSIREDRRDA